jgi:hypothetical protein
VWSEFYGPWRAVAFSFIALVLGLGGLQRERAAGTAPFTLALPVGRGQIVATRVLVGLAELIGIALIPVVMVPGLSPVLAHQSYPASQSLNYAALFLSWGIVWFAGGLVWSAVFRGEFTAATAAVLTPFAYMMIYGASRGDERFPVANPFRTMTGEFAGHLGGTMLLIDPLPWTVMLILAVIAAALFVGAWRATARQSF